MPLKYIVYAEPLNHAEPLRYEKDLLTTLRAVPWVKPSKRNIMKF